MSEDETTARPAEAPMSRLDSIRRTPGTASPDDVEYLLREIDALERISREAGRLSAILSGDAPEDDAVEALKDLGSARVDHREVREVTVEVAESRPDPTPTEEEE